MLGTWVSGRRVDLDRFMESVRRGFGPVRPGPPRGRPAAALLNRFQRELTRRV